MILKIDVKINSETGGDCQEENDIYFHCSIESGRLRMLEIGVSRKTDPVPRPGRAIRATE
jgi:hypothetical protein